MNPQAFPARMTPPSRATELVLLVLAAWAAFIAIPLGLGGIGLSWDALNHHMYLGWIADSPRFDRDFLAASYQSFQYPYLYWPAFKLYESGMGGAWAGAILASLNVTAVPALWLLARACVPDGGWYGFAMRWLAVALGFLGSVALSMFDTTANDLLAAIPLVWAIALAIEATLALTDRSRLWLVVLSGACAGISVAFKLSNGPLAILMPVLWLLPAGSAYRRAGFVFLGCAATLLGFVLAYGPWGWQLWTHYGNPVYPFYDDWFARLRDVVGWHA